MKILKLKKSLENFENSIKLLRNHKFEIPVAINNDIERSTDLWQGKNNNNNNINEKKKDIFVTGLS